MTRRFAIWSAIVACTILIAACRTPEPPPAAEEAPAAPAQSAVDRGKYLVTVQDCNGCHTPFTAAGEPDMTRMLSGHPQDASVTAPARLSPRGWWRSATRIRRGQDRGACRIRPT